MNINAAFPSKYLKAADLGDAQPIVTISHIELEKMPGDKNETRPVVYFEGKSKGVVLNLTNSKAIASIAGTPETDDWAGIQVQLYVAEVSFKSEMVEAIRIRAPKRAARTAPAVAKPKPPVEAESDFGGPDVDEDPLPF
jgi:hypothetical protein